jgi:hypothetical protein
LCADVWMQIFEYFDVSNLYSTFASTTAEVDQLLFTQSNRYPLRGLKLGFDAIDLPAQIPFDRINSLTLREPADPTIVERCSQLKFLKLIGTDEWIIELMKETVPTNVKVTHLTLETTTIKALWNLLSRIVRSFSLHRLEIRTDVFENCESTDAIAMGENDIEQFVFDSCPINNRHRLTHILSQFTGVRSLRMGLIERDPDIAPSLLFHRLHTLHLGLLEVSFAWLIQLLATMPLLEKLKLSGLVDDQNFLAHYRWIGLFQSALTLRQISVNIHLQPAQLSHHSQDMHESLRALNLDLSCKDDDSSCDLDENQAQRWWYLKGLILKGHCVT